MMMMMMMMMMMKMNIVGTGVRYPRSTIQMFGVLGWDRQTHNNQNLFIWMISVAGHSLFEVDEL